MRELKPLAAVVVVLAFLALTTATALSAETPWKWLPGKEKTKVTLETGKLTLQVVGGGSIVCENAVTTSGELTKEQTLAIVTLKLGSKCTFAGLLVRNQGSAENGLITLPSLQLTNCLIAAGEAGVLLKLTEEAKLEVPGTGAKLDLRGSAVVLATPNLTLQKTFHLKVEQTAGVQTIKNCEGGAAQKFEVSSNGGAFAGAGLAAVSPEIRFPEIGSEQEIAV
jgi:hypothetical protein